MGNKRQLLKNNIWVYILIIFSGICISLLSGINPFSGYYHYNDSGAFSYIGKAIYEYSAVPYRDIFDHKGPLLYLINYIGYGLENSIPGDRIYGTWVIEFILIQIDLFLVYFICRKANFEKAVSLGSTMAFAVMFGVFFNFGNFAAEYALPFILISLYLFVEYFLHKEKLPKLKISIIGFSCGSVLMLRPNMIGIWVAFCLVLIIYFIFSKRYIDIFKSITFFLIGILAAIAPFMIYIFVKGVFHDFIYCYWTFNLKYIGKNVNTYDLLIDTYKYFFYPAMMVSVLVYMIQMFKNNANKKIFFYYLGLLLFCIITLYFVVSPHNSHRNYGMFTIPCAVLGVAEILRSVSDFITSKKSFLQRRPLIKPMLLLFVVFIALSPSIFDLALEGYKINMGDKSQGEVSNIEYIKNNTDKDDKILVIGHACYIYLNTDRQASSRYVYQFPIYDIDPAIKEDFLSQLEKNESALIFIPSSYMYLNVAKDTMSYLDKMVSENKYEKIENELFQAVAYKRLD